MAIVFAAIIAIVAVFHPATAIAQDDDGYSLKVTCNKSTGLVLVEPASGPLSNDNDQPEVFVLSSPGDSAECTFSDGRLFKIKIGGGTTFPYMIPDGASPEYFISIWVDQIKVVSIWVVLGRGQKEPRLQRITADNAGINLCRYESLGHYAGDNDQAICKFIPKEEFPKAHDFIEYPISGLRLSAGTKVIDFSSDNVLCSGIIIPDGTVEHEYYWNVSLPEESEQYFAEGDGVPGRIVHPRWEAPGIIASKTFDVDNDGIIDRVYRFHTETHYMDADIYFVSKSSKEKFDIAWENIWSTDGPDEEINLKYMLLNSRYIIPCAWVAGIGKNEACEPLGNRQWYKIKNYQGEEKEYKYVMRYLRLIPFRYRNITYFLGNEVNQDILTIFKPMPRGKVEEICVIRKIKENY